METWKENQARDPRYEQFWGIRGFSGYVLAIAVVCLALLVRAPLYPVLENRVPYLTLFGGVAFTVWIARWRPAALAALVGFVIANLTLSDTDGAPNPDLVFGIEFLGYALSTGFIILSGELMHRSRERAQRDEELVRTTLASIGDGVIVTDVEGRVTSINPEAERLTGWTSAEAAGAALSEVFHIVNEETGSMAPNPVDRALREGVIVGMANHTVLRSKTGTRLPIDDSAAPIRRPDGSMLGAVVVFRDVTGQREAQRARARLAAIVEHSGDAIITKDLNSIVQTWNAGAERLFGYRAEEIVGKPITLLIPPERLHEETNILELVRAGKLAERFETVRVTKGGRAISVAVSVSPLRNSEGKVVGASKLVQDITEIAASRENLRRQKELLQTTLASIGDAVITTDADARITYLNPVAEIVTGWSAESAVGQWLDDVFRIVNEETRHPVSNPAARALREGVIVGLANHTVLIRKDESECPIDDSAAPIHGDGGRVVGCVLVFRDITERARAEAERRALLESERAARADAERANHVKDEFLATLSHELRTPLGAILVWSSLVEKKASDVKTVIEGAQVITRNARVQMDLIGDLLDMSRIVSGKFRLTTGNVKLADAISAGVDAVRHAAAEKKIEIVKSIDPELPDVRGDASRLQQVVWNLMSNAVKFTPVGGRIEISADRQGEGHVRLRVTDTGVGIEPDVMPRIFEQFRQGDESITRKFGGLGLGLTIVKHIVESHGGSVRAESSGEGRGATFTVVLPVGSRQDATNAHDHGLKGVRVLVIDDQVDMRNSLQRLLEDCGAQVFVAPSADDGWRMMTAHRPQIVLCDLGLPGKDGYQFIRELRDAGDVTPALAVTAFVRDVDRARALRAGYQGHLGKPVDPAELIATVATYVKGENRRDGVREAE